ncbi:hypothetical protein CLAFUW4_02979 [Fulvia fulva]|uniref:Nucleotide-diphospho-sugar transferase domain-containing protein n=1 Tax=Passalora fulva TaxID=5499 RepID=A0A9Q8P571_PASFU|nr:uncharacterized protein CLAFUR5_02964 [Fulvia fulva]KAK4632877.1 hypothetical protein CLAFUR0_02975 [Fulvia fulva]UJO13830.1 hypothetical protein CLAFUR5_02964 [Fulvia fulva]WPV11444.1 hypothetical protein CLAFUW4_02979 [Fulvia fulva]
MDTRILKKKFTTSVLLSALCIALLYLFLDYPWAALYVHVERHPGLTEDDIRMFSRNAINNTLVIIPSNHGMLHWVENLLCSLEPTDFDASMIVFWALDENTKVYMTDRNRTAYHNPAFFATSANENRHGDTAAYKRMMLERPKFYIDVLSAGFNILMLDADTIYWQSPLSILPDVSESVDVVYSTDSREFYQDHNAFQDARRRGPYVPPICNGIFWMRSSVRTIALWTEMLQIFDRSWLWRPKGFRDDQRGMDVLLNDGRGQVVPPYPDGVDSSIVPTSPNAKSELGVKVQLLDQTQVVNGHLLMNRNVVYMENLANLRESRRDRIAAHFNWWTEELSKEEGAERLGLYLLDENGRCRKRE